MPIYIHCPNCKTDQNYKNKKCKRCGQLLPQRYKVYRVIVKYAGQTITKCVPNSLELAQKVEAKIKAELVEGSYYDRREKNYTLNDIWGRYLEWAKANKASWQSDKYRYENLIKERFGDKQLDQITPFDIEKFMVELKKKKNVRGKPFLPATIKQYVVLVRALYNRAKKWGLYEGNNPASGQKVKIPKVDNQITEYLEPAQIRRLLQVLDSYHDIQAANLTKFALLTGLRRGELFNLKWDDIDLNNGWLDIRHPKGGKSQKIPLNRMAIETLKNHPKISPYVFPGKDGSRRADIRTAWRGIKRVSGLPEGFRFHGLRHVYATLLASSGQVSPYMLQRLLTHKNFQMTQRYSHILEASFKKSAEVMDEIIAKIENGDSEKPSKEASSNSLTS